MSQKLSESQAPENRRVIAIWLDGFDMELADAYDLVNLNHLQIRGRVAHLDHGDAHLTGLTGEHLSSGLDPISARRASAVLFDPATYRCVHEGARFPPVFTGQRTVVFDMAYFDLDSASTDIVGITDWGVHDPGGLPQSRPETLRGELERRFGRYPAQQWIYGIPWASSKDCLAMGKDLVSAVETRSRIARWLLAERFEGWKLALIGFAESHAASEGLFHGTVALHPWSGLSSAPQAKSALRSVYEAIDRGVGEIVDAFPDDTVVIFSMHGMGPNDSDVPSMALLGEFMARWSGIPAEDACPFALDRNSIPEMPRNTDWTTAVWDSLTGKRPTKGEWLRRCVKRRIPRIFRKRLRRQRHSLSEGLSSNETTLGWMPLMRHQHHWSKMKAFAVPSFYDGRIRVNLQGREASGVVKIGDYEATIEEIERVLSESVESRTGRAIVKKFERRDGDPMQRANDDVDLIVHWQEDVLGISHPGLGVIGPLPPRRTGGHSSPIGRCVVVDPGASPEDLGTHSAFDVIPSIINLVGSDSTASLSGRSFVSTER